MPEDRLPTPGFVEPLPRPPLASPWLRLRAARGEPWSHQKPSWTVALGPRAVKVPGETSCHLLQGVHSPSAVTAPAAPGEHGGTGWVPPPQVSEPRGPNLTLPGLKKGGQARVRGHFTGEPAAPPVQAPGTQSC